MRDDAVLRRALPLGRGLGRALKAPTMRVRNTGYATAERPGLPSHGLHKWQHVLSFVDIEVRGTVCCRMTQPAGGCTYKGEREKGVEKTSEKSS